MKHEIKKKLCVKYVFFSEINKKTKKITGVELLRDE